MTPDERERYSRQVRFAGVGEQGQTRLLHSRIGIIGCGALGSFQAGALARAGVGNIVIVDRDYVEISNLQRQWLFDEEDADTSIPKAVAAARHLRRVNSGIRIEPVVADVTSSNIDDVLDGCSLILDGTDNFETRYLINEYAVANSIPWVYGAAVGSYGLEMPVLPGKSACLVCVYPNPPTGAQPTCETAGVLNPITSIIASLQCADAIKLLTGAELLPRITTVDVWTGAVRQIEAPARDAQCRTCALRQYQLLNQPARVPVSLCGRNAVQIHERDRPLNLKALGHDLEPLGTVRLNEFALRFVAAPYEMTIFPDGRAIIKGTTDIGVARSLYARYVGA